NTALSQVSFVIGLGSSCSQPLLAKRPSSTHRSFLNEISYEPAGPVVVAVDGPGRSPAAGSARASSRATLPAIETLSGASGGRSTTPSWSHRRQPLSKSFVAAPTFQ